MINVLWAGLLVLLSITARAEEVLSINQFSGLNTDSSPLTLSNGQTPDSRNVITDDNPGLQGRKGFIRFSSSPASGNLWEFPLSNGTRYLITIDNGNLKATTDGEFDILIGTVPTDRTVAGAVLGDKFFFSDTLNGLKYWNGTSVTTSSKTMTFDKLVTFKGRLVGAGKSGSERVLFLSKYLDGTNWTLVTDPGDDDPAQITVSGSLDENIQALYSTFQDKLIYFKKNSFGGLSGSRRSNFALRVYSDSIGVSSVETIRDCDGRLRWLGNNRKIYEFDGANFGVISEDIDNIMSNVSQGDANSRSLSLTTESDFSGGTSSPTNFLTSTATIGSIVLSTGDPSIFTDTSQSDFASGTLVNISTTRVADSIALATYTTSPTDILQNNVTLVTTNSNLIGQSFYISTYSIVNSISVWANATVGTGCFPTLYFKNYHPNGPSYGSILATTSGLSGGANKKTLDTLTGLPSNYAVSPGSYSIVVDSCNSSNYLTYSYDSDSYGQGMMGNSSGWISGNDMRFEVDLSPATVFYDTGTIISRTFDVGHTTNSYIWNWDNLTSGIGGTFPTSTGYVTFYTQSSSDSINWDSPISVSTDMTPTSGVKRYIRYLSTITTTAPISYSPLVSDVTLQTTSKRRPSGVYTSPAVDFGTSISQLGPFVAADQTSGGSITYKYQTSTNSSTSLFLSTGWIPITSGNTSTDSVRRYAAVQSSFTATSGTKTFSLDALTFNFTEGSSIKASAGYIDSRYWLGVAYSSTSNNRVLVYDKLRQWQMYDGYVPEVMGLYNSRLYVGNTNGVFLSESGYSDNGSPIVSYYKTKTYAPSGYDLFTKYNYLYLTTDNSDNTLAPTFEIDGNGTDNSFGSTTMNSGTGIQNLKYPFSAGNVQQGKFINMTYTSTGSSFWRLLNANLYFDRDVVPD